MGVINDAFEDYQILVLDYIGMFLVVTIFIKEKLYHISGFRRGP